MKIVGNIGTDRVIDLLRPHLTRGSQLDVVTPTFSLFAFSEMLDALAGLGKVHFLLPQEQADLFFLGGEADRAARNRLHARWLAMRCAEWLRVKGEIRRAQGGVPQGAVVVRDAESLPQQVILGSFSFTTDGLGVNPGNPLSLIQASESVVEATTLSRWFDMQWASLQPQMEVQASLIRALQSLAEHRDPYSIYALTLFSLFKGAGDAMDEDHIVKSATGIRNTLVWKKLYKFQRDGVVGAIDKLNRFGGCIIADSVGLGKTFEALAIIKYHELRNDRVLVLCPKRLRDNWTLYKANDRRNILAADRFNYDVLNHTDLSRDGGASGDIDLAHVNWGNYDLVVIDESNNFSN